MHRAARGAPPDSFRGSLMYYYNLSKRTQLYAGASYANGHDLLDGVDRFNQVFASGGLTYRF